MKHHIKTNTTLAFIMTTMFSQYCYAHGGVASLGEFAKLLLIISLIGAPLSLIASWRIAVKYKKKWIYLLTPVFFIIIFFMLLLLFYATLWVLESL